MTNAAKSISVIGLGNWGTALAQHLARQGHEVVAWTRDRDVAQKISAQNRHPSVFKDVLLDKKIKVVSDINEASAQRIIVYALPSASLQKM